MHLLRNLALPLIFIDTALNRRNDGVKIRFIEERNGNAVFMGFVNDSMESRGILVIGPYLFISFEILRLDWYLHHIPDVTHKATFNHISRYPFTGSRKFDLQGSLGVGIRNQKGQTSIVFN